MDSSLDQYGNLSASYLVATIKHLCLRIQERFPERGLSRIAEHLVSVAEASDRNAMEIRNGSRWLRPIVIMVVIGGFAGLMWGMNLVHEESPLRLDVATVPGLVEFVETSVSLVVFVGAAVVFLLSLDNARRRSLTLRRVHDLRCVAHVIDMHQLHKDPDRLYRQGTNTKSSPMVDMNAFELGRYLDYCSELLALTSKIGALYVQGYEDSVAVSAVDQLESLTTGLSRKIWQKIMVLDRMESRSE